MLKIMSRTGTPTARTPTAVMPKRAASHGCDLGRPDLPDSARFRPPCLPGLARSRRQGRFLALSDSRIGVLYDDGPRGRMISRRPVPGAMRGRGPDLGLCEKTDPAPPGWGREGPGRGAQGGPGSRTIPRIHARKRPFFRPGGRNRTIPPIDARVDGAARPCSGASLPCSGAACLLRPVPTVHAVRRERRGGAKLPTRSRPARPSRPVPPRPGAPRLDPGCETVRSMRRARCANEAEDENRSPLASCLKEPGSRKKKARTPRLWPTVAMVLTGRLELPTYALRVRCSTN